MPVLTTGIARNCFYLFIFYSEKFSSRVWRLPFAVNVNLNLSILLFLTRDFLCHVQGTEIYSRSFTSVLDLDKGYFDRIYGTFLLCFKLDQAPSISCRFWTKNATLRADVSLFMAFSVYDWSRSRGLSVAWLVCLRPTTLQTSHENEFVNGKSHAREKPLLAGYKNACHS